MKSKKKEKMKENARYAADAIYNSALVEYQRENVRKQNLLGRVNSYLTVISLIMTSTIAFEFGLLQIVELEKCPCFYVLSFILFCIVLFFSLETLFRGLSIQKISELSAFPVRDIWNIYKESIERDMLKNVKKVNEMIDDYVMFSTDNARENNKLGDATDTVYDAFSNTVKAFIGYIAISTALLVVSYAK
ncbi:MAG: hypothetical protein IJ158_00535 [Treponema sp.]|nr:hypothetical protein [Treponema sp.]